MLVPLPWPGNGQPRANSFGQMESSVLREHAEYAANVALTTAVAPELTGVSCESAAETFTWIQSIQPTVGKRYLLFGIL